MDNWRNDKWCLGDDDDNDAVDDDDDDDDNNNSLYVYLRASLTVQRHIIKPI